MKLEEGSHSLSSIFYCMLHTPRAIPGYQPQPRIREDIVWSHLEEGSLKDKDHSPSSYSRLSSRLFKSCSLLTPESDVRLPSPYI
ncbi:hypothetical protein Mp_7g11400 [Marchantia polymorpha subsp. ruderalis]|uniref:Uncharacterized protein n=2 Tax=Marchantia polymorpha TaxID=3197 RepID=A0AAF6BYE6_MARPO|nr:hypothetical protein MARPO_0003s0154 [Marchantia polymorpha]BBN17030.1 hypothetical protein Mp_7g11400 [Marchantia polymorpha subsp. ruderalis]|eukprot:PTQ49267.1 hypothetical protein MARPO_0003s0154 [Marchantia polymorpha]